MSSVGLPHMAALCLGSTCPSLDAPGLWELSIQELCMKEHGCLLGKSRTWGPGEMESLFLAPYNFSHLASVSHCDGQA